MMLNDYTRNDDDDDEMTEQEMVAKCEVFFWFEFCFWQHYCHIYVVCESFAHFMHLAISMYIRVHKHT